MQSLGYTSLILWTCESEFLQFGAIKHPDTAVRWLTHIIHVSESKKGETINTLTYLKVNNGLDMAVKTQKPKEHILISVD